MMKTCLNQPAQQGDTVAYYQARCLRRIGVVQESVSYTHLDVYKRQSQDCATAKEIAHAKQKKLGLYCQTARSSHRQHKPEGN